MSIPKFSTCVVFLQIKAWFEVEGEKRILEVESAQEPSRSFEEIRQCLTTVLSEANVSINSCLLTKIYSILKTIRHEILAFSFLLWFTHEEFVFYVFYRNKSFRQ